MSLGTDRATLGGNSKGNDGNGGGNKRSREESRGSGVSRQEEKRVPMKVNLGKYNRGGKTDFSSISDKKLYRQQKEREAEIRKAAERAAHAEILNAAPAGYLEAEGPMEKTYKFTQAAMKASVDMAVANKINRLDLPTDGPYRINYSRNGSHQLLAGRRGHLACIALHDSSLQTEINLNEPLYDATFLQHHLFMATAQKKYAYIYDHTGAEVHVLKNHVEPRALSYLPYHFLLASIGTGGYLKYQDVSTGQLVSEIRTKMGETNVLTQNSWNGMLLTGHSNGVVSMWTPNQTTAAVKIAAHKGPVNAVAVDSGGSYMVTAGADCRIKVFDLRRMQPVHDYFSVSPVSSLDISQRGCVAVAHGAHVQVWGRDFALESKANFSLMDPVVLPTRDEVDQGLVLTADMLDGGYLDALRAAAERAGVKKAKSPYLRHAMEGCSSLFLRFRPFDDVLGIGFNKGVESIVIPGAGEPNYDSKANDPYMTEKGRKEMEVKMLLDKLPSTSITLDPSTIGQYNQEAVEQKKRDEEKEKDASGKKAVEYARTKRRGIRKALKKQANVMTLQREAMLKAQEEEREMRRRKQNNEELDEKKHKGALHRFYQK